ncbi:hypothetical protein O7621_02330 [Solwaraspora sp. WMMD937]|uniref:hypothetical protein n=2 Tax=Micromonosporales TaxID=85008 RepID=UPI00249C8BB9|nr:hypothetical protein [Solwaraspora sp. WMMD937]WFE22229.1 hypothetical protein O7621_02330 [Solwaraspora sp. WMMD937]
MMETDRLMRDADPVADWRVDAESPQAAAMLAGILAQPRSDVAQPSGMPAVRRQPAAVRRVRHRRLAFGGAAAAAVAVALAASTVWLDGPGGATPAYAVTANPDGSVGLMVDWDRLNDPAGLAADLRQAGVPTELRYARDAQPVAVCLDSAGQQRADAALTSRSRSERTALADGYRIRPELFPDGSVMVVSTFSDSATQVTYTMLYLAPADDTSCTYLGSRVSTRYTKPGMRPEE